jgi:hypothetical protein
MRFCSLSTTLIRNQPTRSIQYGGVNRWSVSVKVRCSCRKRHIISIVLQHRGNRGCCVDAHGVDEWYPSMGFVSQDQWQFRAGEQNRVGGLFLGYALNNM